MFLLYHKEMLYVVRQSESSDPQSAGVLSIVIARDSSRGSSSQPISVRVTAPLLGRALHGCCSQNQDFDSTSQSQPNLNCHCEALQRAVAISTLSLNVITMDNTTVRVRCVFLKKKNRLSENPDPACQSFHTHGHYTTFCRQSKGGTPLFYNKKVIY